MHMLILVYDQHFKIKMGRTIRPSPIVMLNLIIVETINNPEKHVSQSGSKFCISTEQADTHRSANAQTQLLQAVQGSGNYEFRLTRTSENHTADT